MRMSMIGGQGGVDTNNKNNNMDTHNKKISNVDEQSMHNVTNNFDMNSIKTDGNAQPSLFNVPEDNSNDSLQDFKIDKKIGSGSFGKVYLVTNKKNNLQFALKILNKKHLYNRNQIK